MRKCDYRLSLPQMRSHAKARSREAGQDQWLPSPFCLRGFAPSRATFSGVRCNASRLLSVNSVPGCFHFDRFDFSLTDATNSQMQASRSSLWRYQWARRDADSRLHPASRLPSRITRRAPAHQPRSDNANWSPPSASGGPALAGGVFIGLLRGSEPSLTLAASWSHPTLCLKALLPVRLGAWIAKSATSTVARLS